MDGTPPKDPPEPFSLPDVADDGWLKRWLSGDGPTKEAAHSRELRKIRQRNARRRTAERREQEQDRKVIAEEIRLGYRCRHGLPKIFGECLKCADESDGGDRYGRHESDGTDPPF